MKTIRKIKSLVTPILKNGSLSLILLIFNVFFVSAALDTSGIYLTKPDFLNKTLEYKTNNNIPTLFFQFLQDLLLSGMLFLCELK